MKFTREEIEAAQRTVQAAMPPTPQYTWPLLSKRLGATLWAKHENHTPVGAFKIRGGLTYFETLAREHPEVRHVISATRGNHGQSLGFAAQRHGLGATIVVPHGNSQEKNAAMRALGVELIEHGDDFQAASEHAALLAERDVLHRVPSFHRELVRGVSTAYVEFFSALKDAPPDVLFVPIGLGSGFAGAAVARAHCGVSTKIIGVVSAHATAYRDSFRAGKPVESPVSTRLADGMACRVPVPESVEVILREADDVITVTDDEVAEAMRILFSDTHNVAEGAGAAALAGALQQQERWRGKTVGISVSGGNVDSDMFAGVLSRSAS
ncbi:threonine dehydratase [Variovorax boronicumulans]|uniref:Threonine dehydratase n=1 Tax=Variovorax boronicumulans TaxID=436515 RepID=A0AAW8D436_9BURK|nr:threonine dehydratase [Variovorax boronicumulans]MDP9895832.1 threonine dehydratase [Variovorax boronicumulans]MDQ0055872.1 threonine dehydratase [Variovorax boronicumulans]